MSEIQPAKTRPLIVSRDRKLFLLGSSIGKKLIVAFSGLILIGYVIGHMAGNLQIFAGQDQINEYAHTLKSMGAVLWSVRLLLLFVVGVHIWLTVQLYFENKAARPVAYARNDTIQATTSSRTMIYSGLGVFLFIVYHLMHFTALITNPEYLNLTDSAGRFDVYSMIILGFRNPIIAGVYTISVFLIASHLRHAVFSIFQTVGLIGPVWAARLQRISLFVAAVTFVGYASIPVAVLLNLLTLPMER